MVQAINTKTELLMKGTSHLGMASYGQIMIGDRGFEYYNERDVRDFIQIPWEEVDSVIASVVFKGRWIPRFAIKTKRNGTYSFSARDPKKILRAIRNHVGPDKMVRSLGFWDVVKNGVKGIFYKIRHGKLFSK